MRGGLQHCIALVCASLLLACPAVQTHGNRFVLHSPTVLRLQGGQAETSGCYFEVLGLSKGETEEHRIRHAYHKMALRCHPDRAPPEKKEQAARAFRALKEAYDVLMDPLQRQAHAGSGDFSAQFMPSARPEDMPSAFDSLSAWEKYFGIRSPSSGGSADEDSAKEGSSELKALEEALQHVYDTPSTCAQAMPSIFDSISTWEKYLGLPVSSAASDTSNHLAATGETENVFVDSMSEWQKYLGLDSPLLKHNVQ